MPVPRYDEREDGRSSGISAKTDQLSEYDDWSTGDNDSALEEDGAGPQLLNKELVFLPTAK